MTTVHALPMHYIRVHYIMCAQYNYWLLNFSLQKHCSEFIMMMMASVFVVSLLLLLGWSPAEGMFTIYYKL